MGDRETRCERGLNGVEIPCNQTRKQWASSNLSHEKHHCLNNISIYLYFIVISFFSVAIIIDTLSFGYQKENAAKYDVFSVS